MLFQEPDDQIFNSRVEDEIGWDLKVRGVPSEGRSVRVASVMVELGLGRFGSSHPHELSRSTRRLVVLASALVGGPRTLFLDESATPLDHERWAARVVRLDHGRGRFGRRWRVRHMLTSAGVGNYIGLFLSGGGVLFYLTKPSVKARFGN